MLALTKLVHVFAVGLWFGTAVFFTFVVGLSLFSTFEELTARPAGERPFWLPAPPELDQAPPSQRFPDPLRKEQGSRIAGAAVGPMFPWYYSLQFLCGVLALATALAWLWTPGAVPKVRTVLLAVALVTVLAGWWLERKVEALRVQRGETSDAVLTGAAPSAEQVAVADQARAEFGRWHGYSLLVNFLTLAMVTAAMALVAWLPVAAPVPEAGTGAWRDSPVAALSPPSEGVQPASHR